MITKAIQHFYFPNRPTKCGYILEREGGGEVDLEKGGMTPLTNYAQTECFIILGHFLCFYPTNNLKNQNFKKMHLHANDNYMTYGS